VRTTFEVNFDTLESLARLSSCLDFCTVNLSLPYQTRSALNFASRFAYLWERSVRIIQAGSYNDSMQSPLSHTKKRPPSLTLPEGRLYTFLVESLNTRRQLEANSIAFTVRHHGFPYLVGLVSYQSSF